MTEDIGFEIPDLTSEFSSNDMAASESDMQAMLNAMSQGWEEVKVEKKEYGEVPPGKYQAFVDRIELKTSTTGNPYLSWGLRIIAGPQRGQFIWRKNMLMNKDVHKRIFKADMSTCGKADIEPKDLSRRKGELLDLVLEVQVQKNGDFTNIYLNRLLNVEIPADLKANEQNNNVYFDNTDDNV